MVLVLYLWVVVGPKKVIPNMTKRTNDSFKLQQVIELLKFALSLDDEEIIKSTIESVIEILEEEISE